MPQEAADQLNIQLVRQLLMPLAPPIPVNHFSITRINDDFLVEPGFFDLVELKDAIEQWQTSKKAAQLSFRVPVRLSMNRSVLVQLQTALSQLLSDEGGE